MVKITRGDGLLDRAQAARLCGVTPDAITNWAGRGYIVVIDGKRERRRLPVTYEDRKPLYDPVELAKAEHATRKRGIHARTGRRPAPRDMPLAALSNARKW